jgi:hypothetical protein
MWRRRRRNGREGAQKIQPSSSEVKLVFYKQSYLGL